MGEMYTDLECLGHFLKRGKILKKITTAHCILFEIRYLVFSKNLLAS